MGTTQSQNSEHQRVFSFGAQSFSSVLHQGHVRTSGLLFDFAVVGELEARKRILSLWSPGAKVFRIENALVLVLASVRDSYSEKCLGAPLVATGSGLTAPLIALPVETKMLQQLHLPQRSLLRFKSGELVSELLIVEEEPSEWLSVGEYVVLPQSVKLDANVFGAKVADTSFDAREAFANVPPPDPAMLLFLESLQRRAQMGNVAAPISAGSVSRGINSALKWASQLLGAGNAEAASGNESLTALKNLGYKLLSDSGLLQLMQNEQERYMHKMMEMFERGDWMEALRFGIPLGGDEQFSQFPWLGIPGPRSSLSFNFGQRKVPASMMVGGPDLHERLRQLYRKAFERLEASGEIDQAAFVLSELLQAHEETASFLEKHGRLKQAAQFAEGKRLKPGLVVRLWFLAADIPRAISIARLTGAFSEAVYLLEPNHKVEADALRRIWANHLADSGNYAGAAQAVMSIADMRASAKDWTKRALDAGDGGAGRLLAAWLQYLEPEDWCEFRTYVEELLADETRERASSRQSFATALTARNGRTPAESAVNGATRVIGRMAARSVLRDYGLGYVDLTKKHSSHLLDFAADPLLRVDVGGCPLNRQTVDISKSKSVIHLTVSASDVGISPVSDCVYLPSRKTLLALGESGIHLLAPDGSVMKHFSVPADEFVVSHSSGKVLALKRRGESLKITQIDCTSFKADYWDEVPVDVYARNYDGSVWYAAKGEAFYVVDVSSAKYKVLWQMPGIEEPVKVISVSPELCSILGSGLVNSDVFGRRVDLKQSDTVFRCELPGLILRQKTPLKPIASEVQFLKRSVCPRGRVVSVCLNDDVGMAADQQNLRVYVNHELIHNFWVSRLDSPLSVRVWLEVSEDWISVIFYDAYGIATRGTTPATSGNCLLFDQADKKLRANIRFSDCSRFSARLQPEHLTLCDSRGRVLILSLKDGTIVNNLRV